MTEANSFRYCYRLWYQGSKKIKFQLALHASKSYLLLARVNFQLAQIFSSLIIHNVNDKLHLSRS